MLSRLNSLAANNETAICATDIASIDFAFINSVTVGAFNLFRCFHQGPKQNCAKKARQFPVLSQIKTCNAPNFLMIFVCAAPPTAIPETGVLQLDGCLSNQVALKENLNVGNGK